MHRTLWLLLWFGIGTGPVLVTSTTAAFWGSPAILARLGDTEDSSSALEAQGKNIRQALRRFRRTVAYSLQAWVQWIPGFALGSAWLILVGAWDRSVWHRLRRESGRAAWQELARGVAIYVRLLRYPGPPLVGKALIGSGLVYAAAVRDLVWDTRLPLGLLDDAALLAIVARSFLWMCPERCVEIQARIVAGRRGRRRRQF